MPIFSTVALSTIIMLALPLWASNNSFSSGINGINKTGYPATHLMASVCYSLFYIILDRSQKNILRKLRLFTCSYQSRNGVVRKMNIIIQKQEVIIIAIF